MSIYTIGWILWGGWFAVEEGLALRGGGVKGTLSYLVWTLGGTRRPLGGAPGPWLRVRRFALAAVMAWLSLHFLTGGLF